MRYKFDETLFDWKRDAQLRGDSAADTTGSKR